MEHKLEPTWEDMLIDIAAQSRGQSREAMREGDRRDYAIDLEMTKESAGIPIGT